MEDAVWARRRVQAAILIHRGGGQHGGAGSGGLGDGRDQQRGEQQGEREQPGDDRPPLRRPCPALAAGHATPPDRVVEV
ncbi:hypothetical protein JMJ56_09680 [Belnapia sp. T18]|uniref:Uncharacterized protein n=2 Tax=Belnapia arida TaxID=2804533 RepID=A0ABS1U0R6_9PROT|nr:hypothetical protein [Belnapia arida]